MTYQQLTKDEMFAMHDKGLLSIEPFEPSLINGSTLDIQIGTAHTASALPLNSDCIFAQEVQLPYLLGPGEIVRVEALQKITLPNNICGIASSPSKYTTHGITVNCGAHIDPGYQGRFTCTIKNELAIPWQINKGDCFISIGLAEHRPTFPYKKGLSDTSHNFVFEKEASTPITPAEKERFQFGAEEKISAHNRLLSLIGFAFISVCFLSLLGISAAYGNYLWLLFFGPVAAITMFYVYMLRQSSLKEISIRRTTNELILRSYHKTK